MADGMPDFEALAETYEKLGEPLTGPFSLQALASSKLPPSAAIVDVAAGTGALAVPAARAGHRVTALDLAAAMVARLEPKLAPFPGCVARTADCTALDAANDSFDAAFSLFGVAILPIWRAGLAEMVRVTRPGGLVVLGAWPGAMGAKPMAVLREVFERTYPGRDFWPDAPFPSWSPQGLHDALAEAGCVAVDVEMAVNMYQQPSAKAFVDHAMPFFRTVPGVADLLPSEIARLEDEYAASLGPWSATGGAIRMPIEALIGIGRKPA